MFEVYIVCVEEPDVRNIRDVCGDGVDRFYSTHVPNAYGVISGACGDLVATGNKVNFFLVLGIGNRIH